MVAGNGKIIWQSEGYKRVRDAHRLCDRTLDGLFDECLVQYTHDSLLPKGRK